MLKDSYIPKNVDVPRMGECLPFWRLNMSPIRGTFSPSGDSMKKLSYFKHFLTVLRILLRKGAC